MKTYRVTNQTSGMDLGLFQADSEEEAVRAMQIDAGYPTPDDVPEEVRGADLVAEEVEPVSITVAQLCGLTDTEPSDWAMDAADTATVHPDGTVVLATAAGELIGDSGRPADQDLYRRAAEEN